MAIKFSLAILTLCFVSCGDGIVFPNGGYNYFRETVVGDTNYISYQLKDSFFNHPQYMSVFISGYYLRSFNEPNLSFEAQEGDCFRFIYDEGNGAVIIVLRKNEIIVKKAKSGFPFPISNDITKLNQIEREHFRVLREYSYLNDGKSRNRLTDSVELLAIDYPEILNPDYFVSLLRKSEKFHENSFTYSSVKVSIDEKTYHDLVQLINDSEFWKSPYLVKCQNGPTHPSSFIFEANTRRKYKIVNVIECDDYIPLLNIACQRLIKLAGLGDEVNLIWN